MERRIETERLILRPIGVEDAPAVFVWASDPEVNRYMSYPLHRDLSETEAWIASIRPEDLEFGFYRKEDGLLIGTGGVGKGGDGLHHLGYNLRRDVWGDGLRHGGGHGDASLGASEAWHLRFCRGARVRQHGLRQCHP